LGGRADRVTPREEILQDFIAIVRVACNDDRRDGLTVDRRPGYLF
jgi:hypothetical protein